MSLEEDIRMAVEVMKRGGVILYPTDTVWGLGCDATNASAIKRIYDIKRRSDSKALISLVSDRDMLEAHVGELPEVAVGYISDDARPTTIVYPSCKNVAVELMASDGSAAMRLTREAYSRSLCDGLGCPVVSTSANVSGETAPVIYPEISEEIREAVDYVAHYRRDDTTVSLPSRIIKLNADGTSIILRQ